MVLNTSPPVYEYQAEGEVAFWITKTLFLYIVKELTFKGSLL